METASLTVHLTRAQTQMICASDVHSLRCAEGAVQLEWEQSGIPFQHVLYGGGMLWEPRGLPGGTWVRLHVIGQRSAMIIQEAQIPDGNRSELLKPLARMFVSGLQATLLLFAKRNERVS